MRRFVIGDIHGCSKALRTILETIAPTPEDQLIFLGDYIDRGPDSRGVIDLMLSAAKSTRTIALRGNHEVMLLAILLGGCDPKIWLQSGGAATTASYGGSIDRIPVKHRDFFQSLRSQYETEREIFVHAGYQHDIVSDRFEDDDRYWKHMLQPPPPHCSGKRVFVGHTPQPNGCVRDLGHVVYVDTYCFGGGYLTAMNIDTGDIIQATRQGHLRRDIASRASGWVSRTLDRLFGPAGRAGHPLMPNKPPADRSSAVAADHGNVP